MPSKPDLAIIIVSYNTKDLLRACLKSIPNATEGLTSETWVVDNNSPDQSAEMVASEFPNVHLIPSRQNLGFTKGNNAALEVANASHFVLLNPDTEPDLGSLTLLVEFLRAHPEVGAVGPKLLNTDGSLQKNGAKFPTPLREFLGVTGLRRINMRKYEIALGYGREDFEQTCEVDQVSGACLMVTEKVMRELGPLDTRFFMFYEEIEYCHRIKSAGLKVYYVAEAHVVHHWMGSVKQVSKSMTAEMFKSQLLYYQKIGKPGDVPTVRLIMWMGLLKNNFIHAGVATKRILRKFGLFGGLKN